MTQFIPKPIETQYKGYRFRSRLEARWAVFFDVLGIKWEYESEGFDLGNGSRYLPDFWLPKFEQSSGMYVEVKPVGDINQFKKPMFFACKTGQTILFAEGTPDFRCYRYAYADNSEAPIDLLHGHFFERENRMYSLPGYENSDLTVDKEHFSDRYICAVRAARSARFEHGETPKV